MEDDPKSFWLEEGKEGWVTHLDGTGLEEEASIIHWAASKGIALADAQSYELWELAAACGLHLKESRSDYDQREIIEKSQAYWEQTSDQRAAKLEGYKARRKEREQARRKVT